jgi:hypothetical protein
MMPAFRVEPLGALSPYFSTIFRLTTARTCIPTALEHENESR